MGDNSQTMPDKVDRLGEGAPPPIERVGSVEIWWVRKPRPPRLSLRFAGQAWLFMVAVLVGTGWWAAATAGPRPLWPWSAYTPTLAQGLLKYALILVAFLTYATVASVPSWWRYVRLGRKEMARIPRHIEQGQWSAAGLGLHRLGLVRLGLGLALPPEAAGWDDLLRPHLSSIRRLYVYYERRRPVLPEPVSGAFEPFRDRLSPPSWLGVLAVAALGLAVYQMVVTMLQPGRWLRLVSLDFALLVVVLGGYVLFFLGRALGRVRYVLIGPGVVEVVQRGLRPGSSTVRRHDLTQADVILDLTGRRIGLGIMPRQAGRKQFWFSRPFRGPLLDAVFLAVLSDGPDSQGSAAV